MLKDAGARGVVKKDTAVQVIIGTQVQFVADEMKKLI
jgi:phosphotransferase system IIB component